MIISNQSTKKSLGILVHPSSLPDGTYCGTFGDGLKKWIDMLSVYKINTWQFLPLTPTDPNGSPYSSPSSFALNPWFLDLAELAQNKYITQSYISEIGPIIDIKKNSFDFVIADKLSIIAADLLLENWSFQSKVTQDEFHQWCQNNKWVDDYSIFMVLKEEFDMNPWWSWPNDFKLRKQDLIKIWINSRTNKLLKQKLVQWHLNRQWLKIKNYAKNRNITLIGDLPFYVSRDSVDVWSNKTLFSITEYGDLIFQSGVPPDYFSSTGQLWGTPVYYWSKHERTNFDWWKKRFKKQFELVDVLRLDHFRALSGYWRVDGNALNAISGKWIKSPGKKLLNSLKDILQVENLPIIAEDLGVITDDVNSLRERFRLPGMKILQFAFDGNENNPYLPSNIEGGNWVVYTGTHDNSTTKSWWDHLEDNLKQEIIKNHGPINDPAWDLIEMGIKTSANLFIAPIQDILSLDDRSRLNTPGTLENNWKWKIDSPLNDIEKLIEKFSMVAGKNLRI